MSPEERGIQRTQLSVGLLEEAICENAFVRVLDLFVDKLGDLTRLGFSMQPDRAAQKGGAPAYVSIFTIKGLVEVLKT